MSKATESAFVGSWVVLFATTVAAIFGLFIDPSGNASVAGIKIVFLCCACIISLHLLMDFIYWWKQLPAEDRISLADVPEDIQPGYMIESPIEYWTVRGFRNPIHATFDTPEEAWEYWVDRFLVLNIPCVIWHCRDDEYTGTQYSHRLT